MGNIISGFTSTIRQFVGVKALISVGFIVACIFAGIGIRALLSTQAAPYSFPASRNVYKWPFSKYAAVNMPIGDKAVYKPTMINAANYSSVTADFDIVYFNPDAPLQDVYQNNASWSGRPRCDAEGGVLYRAKIEPDFIIPGGGGQDNSHGNTPNHSSALLDENNKVVEYQPLTHCPGKPFVNQFKWDNGPNGRYDLNGDNFYGSHGGSGISGAGLAIKVGELMPNSPVRHPIGIQLNAPDDYSCSGGCNRWPALAADSYSKSGYRGPNPIMKPGSLLAIKPGASAGLGLESEPGKMLAWTLENYGAYIVDDAARRVIQIPVEFSPNGDVAKIFKETWGLDFEGGGNAWHRDMQKMLGAMMVVDNNSPTSIGGGGNPLVCLAPPFENGVVDAIASNPNGAVTEPAVCSGGTTPPPPPPTPTPPTPTPPSTGGKPADLNKDTKIDFLDLTLLMKNWKKTSATRAMGDLDGDGSVGILDLSALISAWGT